MKSRIIIFIALATIIISLTGCLYRMDILQGNRIDQQAIGQLELGMTKRQVEFLLGEPSIVDFHRPEFWHYVMYYKSGEDDSEQKRVLSLKFENDRLSEIKGDQSLVLES